MRVGASPTDGVEEDMRDTESEEREAVATVEPEARLVTLQLLELFVRRSSASAAAASALKPKTERVPEGLEESSCER